MLIQSNTVYQYKHISCVFLGGNGKTATEKEINMQRLRDRAEVSVDKIIKYNNEMSEETMDNLIGFKYNYWYIAFYQCSEFTLNYVQY